MFVLAWLRLSLSVRTYARGRPRLVVGRGFPPPLLSSRGCCPSLPFYVWGYLSLTPCFLVAFSSPSSFYIVGRFFPFPPLFIMRTEGCGPPRSPPPCSYARRRAALRLLCSPPPSFIDLAMQRGGSSLSRRPARFAFSYYRRRRGRSSLASALCLPSWLCFFFTGAGLGWVLAPSSYTSPRLGFSSF